VFSWENIKAPPGIISHRLVSFLFILAIWKIYQTKSSSQLLPAGGFREEKSTTQFKTDNTNYPFE